MFIVPVTTTLAMTGLFPNLDALPEHVSFACAWIHTPTLFGIVFPSLNDSVT